MTDASEFSSLSKVAKQILAAGVSILPARLRGKRPAIGAWKSYQDRLPTACEVDAWFANPHDACCLICGTVSGNLELLDFDCAGAAFVAWSDLVTAEAPGLLDRLVIETSPSGGRHVVYRCAGPVPGNRKLAQRLEILDSPRPIERYGKPCLPRRDRHGRWAVTLCLIETRGEGGLFLCAPTSGYALDQGDFTSLPVLTDDEHDVLIRCARVLDEVLPEPVMDPTPTALGTLRPGDAFARQADLAALLRQHGWSMVRAGENQHWCRPGKHGSTSATLRDGVFYVFSSNADPFEPGRAYSPFAVYALLEHRGDFPTAATELRRLGFGDPPLPAGSDVDLSGLAPAPANVLRFDLKHFSQTPERQIDWLWPGVIPRGMLSLIGGKQGLGKSFLICDLAARISAGLPMPDGLIHPPGRVLLLAREDDAACVLLPRLRAAKADLSRVAWSVFANADTGSPIDLASHVDLLAEAVTHHAFDLIVVDTFAAFAPSGTDSNDAQDVRQLLDALSRLARVTQAAVVVVAHLRKTGQGDGDPMDAIAGSAQMTAGVRVAALLDKGQRDGERWLRVVKSNLGPFDTGGYTWRFVYDDPFGPNASAIPHLEWASAGAEYRGRDEEPHEPAVTASEVREVLLDLLADGPRLHREVIELAISALRQRLPRLRKRTVETAILEALDHDADITRWEGARGARMLGLAKDHDGEEDAEDRALRLAQANPELTVRALRELAGCRRDVAALALRLVRSDTGATTS